MIYLMLQIAGYIAANVIASFILGVPFWLPKGDDPIMLTIYFLGTQIVIIAGYLLIKWTIALLKKFNMHRKPRFIYATMGALSFGIMNLLSILI